MVHENGTIRTRHCLVPANRRWKRTLLRRTLKVLRLTRTVPRRICLATRYRRIVDRVNRVIVHIRTDPRGSVDKVYLIIEVVLVKEKITYNEGTNRTYLHINTAHHTHAILDTTVHGK